MNAKKTQPPTPNAERSTLKFGKMTFHLQVQSRTVTLPPRLVISNRILQAARLKPGDLVRIDTGARVLVISANDQPKRGGTTG